VIFDVTHAIRVYGVSSSKPEGGEPQYIFPLARAAVACGVEGLFLETHPRCKEAKCDAASMLPLSQAEALLSQIAVINQAVKGFD
jgi:2-dehydro-3-deoxyphosphooctonate aldolase (KDO 8-P synthase)